MSIFSRHIVRWSRIVDNDDGRLAKITIFDWIGRDRHHKKKTRYKVRWGAVHLSMLVVHVVIHTDLITQQQW